MNKMGISMLIKFNDEEIIVNNKKSTTTSEHLNVLNQKGKVIW